MTSAVRQQHRQHHRQHRDHQGGGIFGQAHHGIGHAAGCGRYGRSHHRALGHVHRAGGQQAQDQGDDRVDVRDHLGRGGEQDGAGGWAEDGLDQVVDVIDRRDLVGEKLDRQ
jgi:hypothetical protein